MLSDVEKGNNLVLTRLILVATLLEQLMHGPGTAGEM